MKVLYLTKYSRKGASSRLRSYQYFPFLEDAGLTVSVRPLFNDGYLEELYAGRKPILSLFLAYIHRFFVLFTVFKYDKIVIEKELFPYFPAFFEYLLSFFGVSYIVDYDDAIFHNYDLSSNAFIRFFLKNKINSVMKCATTVVVGNDYLAAKAIAANSKKVIVIPTVIDITRYTSSVKTDHTPQVIGWIGSPSTFKYVKFLFPVFETLFKKYPIEVHIIGAKEEVSVSFPIRFINWTEASEVTSICNFDIGIMPLVDSQWEKGKCAYKLIQYMACGIPVVASPVGMNTIVVRPGENGFLATSLKEWTESLEETLKDRMKCYTFGARGRQLIESCYTLQKTAPKWITILKSS